MKGKEVGATYVSSVWHHLSSGRPVTACSIASPGFQAWVVMSDSYAVQIITEYARVGGDSSLSLVSMGYSQELYMSTVVLAETDSI